VYACRRPSGPQRFLFRTGTPESPQLQLAGTFVVWRQETAAGVQRLAVLNVRTGKLRRVGSLLTGGHMIGPGIAAFVARSDGAIIWLDNVGSQEGPFFSYASTLYKNSGRATAVLDRRTKATNVFRFPRSG
jgi:hypothetical protein